MGISSPALLFTHKNIANCFNLGNREGGSTIVISKWLVSHLNSKELESVLAHEIAHAKNKDVTLMAYLAAARHVFFISPFFIFAGALYIFVPAGVPVQYFLFSPHFWILILVIFFMYFPLTIGIQWFSRLREATADARASLVVNKDILAKTLFKITYAKSMQMVLVSSCIMISPSTIGGILSTHPGVHNRIDMLKRDKYVTDIRNPPSLRVCFTYAVGILLFIQLVNFVVGTPLYFVTGHFFHGAPVIVFDAVLVAVLFVLYYDYVPLTYIGIIIFLVSVLRVIMVILVMIPTSFATQEVLPITGLIEAIPSVRMRALLLYLAILGENVNETVVNNLKGIIYFAFIAFLARILLGYAKKYINLIYLNLPLFS
jgi:hypothetical protein